MNLHHLELFYHVSRHGGISRAVRHMPYGIQQPAVSTQILLLEQDLNTKLFDRRPFRLTRDGAELYEFVRPFFENVEAVGARLRNKRAPKLRVGAAEIVLREYLPAILREVRKTFPEVRFGLRSGTQSELEHWLVEGELDFAIVTLVDRGQRGLKYHSIVKLPLVLLVHRTSAVKSASDLWGQDRIEEPLICMPPSESVCRSFQKGLQQLKVDWPTSVEASSAALVTRYVADGYGIGVTVNVPSAIEHPDVRVIPLRGFDLIEIAVLWRSPGNALQSALLKAIQARARQLWPT